MTIAPACRPRNHAGDWQYDGGLLSTLRAGVLREKHARRVLTNDDCWGLPSADQGLCRRLACRWWIAQHPPRTGGSWCSRLPSPRQRWRRSRLPE